MTTLARFAPRLRNAALAASLVGCAQPTLPAVGIRAVIRLASRDGPVVHRRTADLDAQLVAIWPLPVPHPRPLVRALPIEDELGLTHEATQCLIPRHCEEERVARRRALRRWLSFAWTAGTR